MLKLPAYIAIFILLLSQASTSLAANTEEKAIFAGGCFWCMESDFEKLDGVSKVVSGYTAGKTENPTYQEVSHGNTGHYEAVEVTYDPEKISYPELLSHYWKNIDPYDSLGQFCDKGDSYLSAIFPLNEKQREQAQQSLSSIKKKLDTDKIATRIIDAKPFYLAETYHQDYYLKNPKRYKVYRWGCGRDNRLEEIWGPKE
jgi:peptide-methionine (S)-S-oxide reductase